MSGTLSLARFAYLLTLVEALAAGPAHAAFGDVYTAASPAWLRAVEACGRPAET